MAAKIFVFVISRNFHEIINFVFREIFLEFREISQNTKSKFGRNFRNFANHEIKIWAIFCYILCVKNEFSIKKNSKLIVHQILMSFDNFSFEAKKVLFS